jgi:N-acetylglucosaminyldiphosphoundecaprenol N-acetyl-beta-D-mannosaminyltransferase
VIQTAVVTADRVIPRLSLLGVGIDCVDQRGTIDWIARRVKAGDGGFVVTVNLDHLRRCVKDSSYAHLVARADLVVADGMPLIWASRLRGGRQLPERVAGSSTMIDLCERAALDGVGVFLLGGDPGVAERAGTELQSRFEGLRIAGVRCPPFGFESDDAEMAAIREQIRSSDAGIVLVALGSPKQEMLIDRIRDCLPGACWMGIGISLSFVAGDVRRAPVWLQRLGLEWVHRLMQEPRRLFKRYIVHGIPWGLRLMFESIINRIRPSDPVKETIAASGERNRNHVV